MVAMGGELVLLSVVLSMVASLILFGHVLANRPLDLIGKNRGAGYCTRILGYDSSRGEFSLMATAGILIPPLCLLLWTVSGPARAVAICVVPLAGIWYRTAMHVSHPGGARPHRILREPQWEDRTWHMDVGWRCKVACRMCGFTCMLTTEHVPKQVAEASHRATHAELPNGHELTGEPAGRQTWHHTPGGAGAGTPPSFEVHGSRSCEREPVHTASFSFNLATNPNPEDEIWRAQRVAAWRALGKEVPDASWRPTSTFDFLKKALRWYEVLQSDDSHWAGDYGGPHFLLPGLVVVWHITGWLESFLCTEQCAAMAHYLRVHQQLDGGWGMHIESPSTMFGSCMCYIALRLLGVAADEAGMVRGREFIHLHGGGTYTGTWAKFYMCLLGVMDWRGHQVIPPEMWLLPRWFPFHPGRMWCHCRMVYLLMCYLYGHKLVYANAETDPLVAALCAELYTVAYSSICWEGTADLVADVDNYSPIHPLMTLTNTALAVWERCGRPLLRMVRAQGLAFALDYIRAEDEQTNYVCIGPVNKVLNMLAAYHANSGDTTSAPFQKHLLRVPDYLWVSEDGMKMQGYNGSQVYSDGLNSYGQDEDARLQRLAGLGHLIHHAAARRGYSSWGCCFTYGTWFGVEGLVLSGEPTNSPELQCACSFLLSKQNSNGGWGEDFTSCYDKAYTTRGMRRYGKGGSGVVNTAWALLALMAAKTEDRVAVRCGIEYLTAQQHPNSDWKQEGIAGVFNRACGISYTQYRNLFPMWALARYARHFE